ncbi:MAG: serine hydrolase domain-containing protein [Planctomycetota bacterium]
MKIKASLLVAAMSIAIVAPAHAQVLERTGMTTPQRLVVEAAAHHSSLGIFVEALNAAGPFLGPPVHGDAPPTLEHLDEIVLDFMDDNDLTGLTVSITREERLVYTKSFGYRTMDFQQPLNTDHRLKLGSVSKIITTIAMLKLLEQHPELDLDTPVFGFTHMGYDPGILDHPKWSAAMSLSSGSWSEFGQYQNITLRHLLSHASGFDKINEGQWDGQSIEAKEDYSLAFLANCPLTSIPGTNCDYENQNLGLIGVVIEEVSGQTYEDYVRSNVLDPLGLDHICTPGGDAQNAWRDAPMHVGDANSWDVVGIAFDPLKVKGYPAGGWLASSRDLVRLLCAIDTSGGRPNILLPSSIAPMKTRQFSTASGAVRSIGWRINAATEKIAHGGDLGGGHAYVGMFPADSFSTAFPDTSEDYEVAPINIAIAVNCDGSSSSLAGLSDSLALEVAQVNLAPSVDFFPTPWSTVSPVYANASDQLAGETFGEQQIQMSESAIEILTQPRSR